MQIAVAAPSRLAADAAVAMSAAGGGAMDAAVAATIVAMISEPGVCAPGAGGFIAVRDAGGACAVYDGYMAAPGLGGPVTDDPVRSEAVMEYGGGITTLVGPASVAVPGAWAALADAHGRHGRLPWAEVLTPAIRCARDGFPIGTSSAYYLGYSHEAVFGHDPACREVLCPHGRPPEPGERIVQTALAGTLAELAVDGAETLYRGRLAERIASDLGARGGLIGLEDLAAYRGIRRDPVLADLGDWRLAANPPPAVGGAAMLAILLGAADDRTPRGWATVQERVFRWRRAEADLAPDREAVVGRLLDGLPGDPIRSASTVHVSVVDEDGVAVAATMSAGYGSGVVPAGTGFMMNNALGELELVGDGSHLTPGDRLNSNMAPTIAWRPDGTVLALGSPGADRISSAIAQTAAAIVLDGADPGEAVRRPRVHADVGDEVVVAVEPGVDVTGIDRPIRAFDGLHMYFGGVGLAMRHPDGRLEAVADPRRAGSATVT